MSIGIINIFKHQALLDGDKIPIKKARRSGLNLVLLYLSGALLFWWLIANCAEYSQPLGFTVDQLDQIGARGVQRDVLARHSIMGAQTCIGPQFQQQADYVFCGRWVGLQRRAAPQSEVKWCFAAQIANVDIPAIRHKIFNGVVIMADDGVVQVGTPECIVRRSYHLMDSEDQ